MEGSFSRVTAPVSSLRFPRLVLAGSILSFCLFCGFRVSSLSGQERPIVMIDAGHGGDEIGVQDGDLLEKDLVLRIAYAVASEFVEGGYDVRLTRTGDYAVAWADRRVMAEDEGASLLLMLHINGNEDRTRHGAEVYVNEADPASSRAAAAVASALEDAGSAVVVEARDWPFLASPTVPTVMIELAFMTHPVERRLLLSEDFHHEVGEALLRAASSLGARPSPGSR